MNSSECATFILRTSDLPTFANGANEKGSTNNASHSSFSWNNIDFKSILGNMWEKYDYFNIALVSNVSSPTTLTYTSNDNRIGMVYMDGLKWTGSNYDTGTKSNTTYAPIGSINFSTLTATVAVVNQYNSLFFNTFGKTEPYRKITIFYKRISDNLPNATATGTFPPTTFLFKIYGIKDVDYSTKKLIN